MTSITESDVHALVPYTQTLGMTFPTIGPDAVEAYLAHSEPMSTVGGGLHGGALLSLADAAAAVLATAVHPDGSLPATTESSMHFLAPVRTGATARAVPLRVGKRSVVVRVEVFDEAEVRCAVSTQTVARRAPERRPVS